MVTAFQADAFQNNAFQIVAVKVIASGGGIGHGSKKTKKTPDIAVVTVDGQDYRVPIKELPAFLARKREELQEPAAVEKVIRKRSKKAEATPPRISVKLAPAEFKALVEATVDKSNEILAGIWEGLVKNHQREMEDEETLILLLIA